MRCAIWYHLHNLKNGENNHRGVLLLVKLQATLLKLTLLQGFFSRFLNCTNGNKLRKASNMIQEVIEENFCISCRNRYSKTDTSDWLKCAVCKQCFHENCFKDIGF